MTIEEIRQVVADEFRTVADRFKFIEVDLRTALSSERPQVGRGVYVFWTPKGVVRVGKSSSRDVCQRAIEHVRDNTGGVMGALREDPTTKVLFFVAESSNDHWILALETFLDTVLKPQIPAKRQP